MEWIYFCRVQEPYVATEHIKIGRSKNLAKRIHDLEKGSAASTHRNIVELLAAVVANNAGANESLLHRHFKPLQINGENFRAIPPLTSYVRWLRDNWWCTTELNLIKKDGVDFTEWQPGNARQLEPAVCGPLFPPSPEDHLVFATPEYTDDDYHTPATIIDRVHECFGFPDLDPASHPVANRLIKAKKIYTTETNGLLQGWHGNVWCNPPFSKMREFIEKAISEKDNYDQMLFLHPCRQLSAKYFQPILADCDLMLVMAGRHQFGGLGGASDDGHCLLYFGSRRQQFTLAMESLGIIWNRFDKMLQSQDG